MLQLVTVTLKLFCCQSQPLRKCLPLSSPHLPIRYFFLRKKTKIPSEPSPAWLNPLASQGKSSSSLLDLLQFIISCMNLVIILQIWSHECWVEGSLFNLPRRLLAFFAARTHCWLMLLSTRTPEYFPAKILSSQSSLCLRCCVGSLCPRCNFKGRCKIWNAMSRSSEAMFTLVK